MQWITVVLFAFVTNKTWVFDDKGRMSYSVLKKLTKFGLARVATGMIDLVTMYVFVDILGKSSLVVKVVSNVIVIILNFVFSRMVFKQ